MPPDEAPAPEVPPSSRLCVKNIPKYVDEARLRDFFSAKGEVTDVKVLRTKDGRSRQLGFIGFKSVDEAAAALRYYNRSYMDTAKLAVEFARKVGDEQLPRAWSKHTHGTTANRKLMTPVGAAGPGAANGNGAAGAEDKKGGKKGNKGESLPEEEDPKLREFLALMQPRSKARIWANDELPEATAAGASAAAAEQPKQKRAAAAAAAGKLFDQDDDVDDDDEGEEHPYQDWTDAVAGGRRGGGGGGCSDDGEEVDVGMASGSDDGDDREEEGGPGRKQGLGRDEVVVNEAISDLEYLRSRMRRWDESEDGDSDDGDGGGKAAAEARGDQTGVGISPRCEAAAAVAAAGGWKKIGKEITAATPAVKHTRRRADENGDGGGSGGNASDDDDDIGRGLRDADGDDDMVAAAVVPLPQSDADGDEEGILETGRLFVRNLAYTATETDLSDLFGAFGDLHAVHLLMDRETKRSKGLAYVQYQIPEDAVRAAQQLDGTIYQGRLLHILPAKRQPGGNVPPPPPPASADPADPASTAAASGSGGGGTSSFKAQREAQRKADAGNRSAWNTLFMRADTVADAVAAHYGLSKAALLDASTSGAGGESVAVRMALGEAQVIAATKQALSEAGVSVEALERAAAASGKAAATRSVARSGTTLLVKNLPYSADEDELVELFGRHGPVSRLVLPPARALALVEFSEPQDARAAFQSLAYKKYRHVPLYLEWAPADVFTAPAPAPKEQHPHPQQHPQHQQAATAKTLRSKGAKAGTDAAEIADAADGDDDSDDADADVVNPAVLGTIYVKNLAFSTGDAALRKHFDGAVSVVGGSLHSALVARKKVPGTGKDGGSTVVQSLGYGFVEVDSEAVATAVIKKLQGSVLDGHKLVLQLSKGRKSSGAAAGSSAPGAKAAAGAPKKGGEQDGSSTKVVIRNLAFEATKKDIQGLFNPFGHLKSCRLPKKFDGSHRGFAFVEFVTKQEAKNALEGVAGTHLYGRRLVVEYAREDDTLDDIRNKTAAKFKRDGELVAGDAPAKRLKV